VLALAILSPGAAAFADQPASNSNASCNNMKGGNGGTFSQHGKVADVAGICSDNTSGNGGGNAGTPTIVPGTDGQQGPYVAPGGAATAGTSVTTDVSPVAGPSSAPAGPATAPAAPVAVPSGGIYT
jgi:hypothetical protein